MTTEKTRAGLQHVMPGAERASDATVAQRRADAPLRPNKPQVSCNHGLFGDSAAQFDLVELAHQRGRQARTARRAAFSVAP